MTPDPEATLDASTPERCKACGFMAVERERVLCDRNAPRIEAMTCVACGEWWFEAAGEAITLESIVRLGLDRRS